MPPFFMQQSSPESHSNPDPGQLLLPQMRSPTQSLSLSQSPSPRLHWPLQQLSPPLQTVNIELNAIPLYIKSFISVVLCYNVWYNRNDLHFYLREKWGKFMKLLSSKGKSEKHLWKFYLREMKDKFMALSSKGNETQIHDTFIFYPREIETLYYSTRVIRDEGK